VIGREIVVLNEERFRDPRLAKALIDRIQKLIETVAQRKEGLLGTDENPINLMEVCGTHTVNIFRSGLRSIFDEMPGLRLLSGPGCPVCVTTNMDIDAALAIAARDDVVFATFGDMVKVPGSKKSFAVLKAEGASIRLIYSPTELIEIAESAPDKQVSFLSIGFETTTPGIAYAIKKAKALGIRNLSIVASNKLVPPALNALCANPDVNLNGFVLPGHVTTIIGLAPYEPVARDFAMPCVVTGFEPVDILRGVEMLVAQLSEGRAEVECAYRRAVPVNGNPDARKIMSQVFEPTDMRWRGLGVIPQSGLKLNAQYEDFDARNRFNVEASEEIENPKCRCGDVLIGKCLPTECELFGRGCDPEHPLGACMVSSEGTCAAYYRFGFT